MNNSKSPEYKTRELSLATYLISMGLKFLYIEALTPEAFWFVFEEPERCYEFEKKFLETKEALLKEMRDYQQKQYE